MSLFLLGFLCGAGAVLALAAVGARLAGRGRRAEGPPWPPPVILRGPFPYDNAGERAG